MRRGFKLSTLDADTVAHDTAREVLDVLHGAASALGIEVNGRALPDLRETPVYSAIMRLSKYARGGKASARVSHDAARLRQWCGTDAVSTTTKTKTPLQLLLTAVEARQAYDRTEALTSAQVAALCDLDRDHVNGMAARGEIPGAYRSDDTAHRPWRFKGETFRGWLESRIETDREYLAEVAS
jgi:hypothetical protein